MLLETDIFARARAGAAWLDKLCPTWFNWVDTFYLRLCSSNVCVLGQLSKHNLTPPFDYMCHNATGDRDLVEFGFSRPAGLTSEEAMGYWETLDWAWKKEIASRRRQAVPGDQLFHA